MHFVDYFWTSSKTSDMANCVKCLSKQLKEIITIKRESNKKLFETLFKDDNAAHLTICKNCFGEIAEFLDEEDFIDEIPVSWMQEDNETVKEEGLDCEQELTRYEIIGLPLEKITSALTYNNNYKYQQIYQEQISLIKTVQNLENVCVFKPNDKDFPNTEDQNCYSGKCRKLTKRKVKHSTKISKHEEVSETFVISDDSNSLDLQTVNQNNLSNDVAGNSNSAGLQIEDEITTLPDRENVNCKEELQSIPTFEIDNESDNSVQFLDELRFEPPQNIAEDSVENIDFKQDIDAFEIQDASSTANSDEATQASAIESDQNSCSIDEQMRILHEFEEQCEIIEQRLAQDKQNEDLQKQAKKPTDCMAKDYENSISCRTFRFNTNSCDSNDVQSFICSACGQISNKLWKIQEHITLGTLKSACKNAQIEQQKLEHGICCEFCGLLYRHPTDLQAHRATGVHSDLQYTCPECFQCFKEFKALNSHTETHAKLSLNFNTVFMCNVGDCIELCLDWPSLNKHKNRCHVAQICPICREQFHDGRFFRIHVKNCKEVKEKCEYCVKKFHNSCLQTFTTHGKDCLSLKEKNFHCDKCEARFKTDSDLLHHNTLYHQPVDCKHCGKIFRNKRSLHGHIPPCTKRKRK